MAAACGVSSASAAVPSTSSVEGALFAAGGGAATDGNYSITFSLYKDELGGNPLWAEGPILIAVKSGQWQHQLGSKSALSATVLNGASLWLGMQIASDPELPRKPLASTIFAVRAAIADGLECTGCVGAAQIDSKFLAGFAKSSDLSPVATSGEFKDLKGGPDLAAYAKTAALAAVATSGNYGDIKNAPDLNAYAKVSALAAIAQSGSYKDIKDGPALSDVAKTGEYGDLLNKPVLPQLGKACGTNLVMAGIKADGSYQCAASAIAPDLIDEISNNLIFNQFVDSKAGTVDNAIPDGSGAGKSDSLDFPDIGSAQAIWINVALANSDVSKVKIELYGPNMATPYVLYNGEKAGTGFSVAFNKDTALSTGDMNKDWIGKNIKGTWSITVKDPIKNQSGANDGKFSWDVTIQTLSSKKIQVKGSVIVDSDLTVGGNLNVASVNNSILKPFTYRWGRSQGHDNNHTWPMGNSGDYSLGIAPSTWSNGGVIASASADKELWRMTFVNGGRAEVGGALINQVIPQYSDSNMSEHYFFMFRIQNSTLSSINWAPTYWFSCGGNWSDYSSATINGANTWSSSSACYAGNCPAANPTFAVPANRVSTVMFAISSSVGWAPANFYHRLVLLAFTKGSLKLPAGLKYVDDIDTATGGWEQ